MPVLAPGTGKTRTGRLWAYVPDDRPAGDTAAPAVWYAYSPDRKGEHSQKHLREFRGYLQADGYAGFILPAAVTRVFWPLSRRKHAKQLLALDGKQTMIQQTVRRLLPLAPASHCWIISNGDLSAGVLKQLPRIPATQVIAEPAGRNTAPAIGLAAFILSRQAPRAVLGLFPSDQVVEDERQYQRNIQRAVEIAAAGENIVTLGINPSRPETGDGYIEARGEVETTVSNPL